jgi:hypothetical protein
MEVCFLPVSADETRLASLGRRPILVDCQAEGTFRVFLVKFTEDQYAYFKGRYGSGGKFEVTDHYQFVSQGAMLPKYLNSKTDLLRVTDGNMLLSRFEEGKLVTETHESLLSIAIPSWHSSDFRKGWLTSNKPQIRIRKLYTNPYIFYFPSYFTDAHTQHELADFCINRDNHWLLYSIDAFTAVLFLAIGQSTGWRWKGPIRISMPKDDALLNTHGEHQWWLRETDFGVFVASAFGCGFVNYEMQFMHIPQVQFPALIQVDSATRTKALIVGVSPTEPMMPSPNYVSRVFSFDIDGMSCEEIASYPLPMLGGSSNIYPCGIQWMWCGDDLAIMMMCAQDPSTLIASLQLIKKQDPTTLFGDTPRKRGFSDDEEEREESEPNKRIRKQATLLSSPFYNHFLTIQTEPYTNTKFESLYLDKVVKASLPRLRQWEVGMQQRWLAPSVYGWISGYPEKFGELAFPLNNPLYPDFVPRTISDLMMTHMYRDASAIEPVPTLHPWATLSELLFDGFKASICLAGETGPAEMTTPATRARAWDAILDNTDHVAIRDLRLASVDNMCNVLIYGAIVEKSVVVCWVRPDGSMGPLDFTDGLPIFVDESWAKILSARILTLPLPNQPFFLVVSFEDKKKMRKTFIQMFVRKARLLYEKRKAVVVQVEVQNSVHLFVNKDQQMRLVCLSNQEVHNILLEHEETGILPIENVSAIYPSQDGQMVGVVAGKEFSIYNLLTNRLVDTLDLPQKPLVHAMLQGLVVFLFFRDEVVQYTANVHGKWDYVKSAMKLEGKVLDSYLGPFSAGVLTPKGMWIFDPTRLYCQHHASWDLALESGRFNPAASDPMQFLRSLDGEVSAELASFEDWETELETHNLISRQTQVWGITSSNGWRQLLGSSVAQNIGLDWTRQTIIRKLYQDESKPTDLCVVNRFQHRRNLHLDLRVPSPDQIEASSGFAGPMSRKFEEVLKTVSQYSLLLANAAIFGIITSKRRFETRGRVENLPELVTSIGSLILTVADPAILREGQYSGLLDIARNAYRVSDALVTVESATGGFIGTFLSGLISPVGSALFSFSLVRLVASMTILLGERTAVNAYTRYSTESSLDYNTIRQKDFENEMPVNTDTKIPNLFEKMPLNATDYGLFPPGRVFVLPLRRAFHAAVTGEEQRVVAGETRGVFSTTIGSNATYIPQSLVTINGEVIFENQYRTLLGVRENVSVHAAKPNFPVFGKSILIQTTEKSETTATIEQNWTEYFPIQNLLQYGYRIGNVNPIDVKGVIKGKTESELSKTATIQQSNTVSNADHQLLVTVPITSSGEEKRIENGILVITEHESITSTQNVEQKYVLLSKLSVLKSSSKWIAFEKRHFEKERKRIMFVTENANIDFYASQEDMELVKSVLTTIEDETSNPNKGTKPQPFTTHMIGRNVISNTTAATLAQAGVTISAMAGAAVLLSSTGLLEYFGVPGVVTILPAITALFPIVRISELFARQGCFSASEYACKLNIGNTSFRQYHSISGAEYWCDGQPLSKSRVTLVGSSQRVDYNGFYVQAFKELRTFTRIFYLTYYFAWNHPVLGVLTVKASSAVRSLLDEKFQGMNGARMQNRNRLIVVDRMDGQENLHVALLYLTIHAPTNVATVLAPVQTVELVRYFVLQCKGLNVAGLGLGSSSFVLTFLHDKHFSFVPIPYRLTTGKKKLVDANSYPDYGDIITTNPLFVMDPIESMRSDGNLNEKTIAFSMNALLSGPYKKIFTGNLAQTEKISRIIYNDMAIKSQDLGSAEVNEETKKFNDGYLQVVTNQNTHLITDFLYVSHLKQNEQEAEEFKTALSKDVNWLLEESTKVLDKTKKKLSNLQSSSATIGRYLTK